jgi:heme-degrading monooxygenase HmoA
MRADRAASSLLESPTKGAAMFARVSRYQEDIDKIDEATRLSQEKILPQVESMAGFLGVTTLANRTTGETLSITYWESEDAMRASEEEANRLRAESTAFADGEILGVDRYEVTLRVGV